MKIQNILLAVAAIVIVWLYFSLTEKDNEIIDLKTQMSEYENRVEELNIFIELLNDRSNERQSKIDSLLKAYENIPSDDKIKGQNPIVPVRVTDDWQSVISPIEQAIDSVKR